MGIYDILTFSRMSVNDNLPHRFSTRSDVLDLILNQQADGICELIDRPDSGKIPPVNGFCRRQILIIPCKDTDHRYAVRTGAAHLVGSVADADFFLKKVRVCRKCGDVL